MSLFRLDQEKSLLLCVDMQERLALAMEPMTLAHVTKNAVLLTQAATELGVPMIVAEQYRKGLGSTFPVLQSVMPPQAATYEKIEFSAWANDSLRQAIINTGCTQIVVMGMESHVCVFQTARDLLAAGYVVHIPQDVVISRSRENCEQGLRLSQQAGAVITTTETILFDWLKKAGTPAFKKISSWIKHLDHPK